MLAAAAEAREEKAWVRLAEVAPREGDAEDGRRDPAEWRTLLAILKIVVF